MKKMFINISKLLEQFGNLEDTKEVLHLFLSEISESLESLKMASKDKNMNKLYQNAHKLKGSCQSMEMEKCSELLDFLGNETKKDQNETKIEHLIEKIAMELDGASEEIQKFFAEN